MNRARTGATHKLILPVEKRAFAKITPQNVKLCDLCATLNLETNRECWACRWHGTFSRDEQVIALAWLRLDNLYEEVRAEHVTARHAPRIGDFGAARPSSLLEKITAKASLWWRRFQDSRDLRMAQRQARLHSRMPARPDHSSK